MNGIEVIDRLCGVISEQAEIIREQAFLLGQLDCGELSERRADIDNKIKEILKGRTLENEKCH